MEACTYGFFALALSGFWPFIGALILASIAANMVRAIAVACIALMVGGRK